MYVDVYYSFAAEGAAWNIWLSGLSLASSSWIHQSNRASYAWKSKQPSEAGGHALHVVRGESLDRDGT